MYAVFDIEWRSKSLVRVTSGNNEEGGAIYLACGWLHPSYGHPAQTCEISDAEHDDSRSMASRSVMVNLKTRVRVPRGISRHRLRSPAVDQENILNCRCDDGTRMLALAHISGRSLFDLERGPTTCNDLTADRRGLPACSAGSRNLRQTRKLAPRTDFGSRSRRAVVAA